MVSIKRVEIRGFKSLGARPVALGFEPGLTAITGPNGSGKSNIVDGILFCLGENSPRALRVNRLSSLLYDGGIERESPVTMRVSVHFDNSDRRIPLDSDTVVATREMKRDGESIYFLNGRRVHKAQLTETLELAMISPAGLNVVPQGMVTRTSELLPDEKREIIEDAVGISQFDEKKTEAIKQLQHADTKLQIAVARIGEIKSRVESLEAERNDQLRLKQLENQIGWLKGVIISGKINSVKSLLSEQRGVLRVSEAKKAEYLLELERLKGEVSLVEGERKQFVETIVEGGGSRQVEIELEIARTTSTFERLKSDIEESESVLAKADENLPYLRGMEEKHVGEIEELRLRIRESLAKIEKHHDVKKQTERQLLNLTKKVSTLRRSRDASILKAQRLGSRINEQSAQAADLGPRVEALKDRLTLLRERLQSVEEKTSSFLETLRDLQANLEKLKDLRRQEGESLSKVDASLARMTGGKERIEAEIATAIDTLEKASTAVTRYEVHRELGERLVSEEIVHQKLRQLSEAGAVEGLVGKVGDEISYDRAYERAILAVGRRWVNAVLVEDLRSLLKIAEVVRRLRLGRIILIPVSEVRNTRAVSSPRAEGVLGPLADYISAPKKLIGAVNFIFGDTVLVNSAKAAYLLASRGVRAVTTSGDVFEPNSTAFETGQSEKFESVLQFVLDPTSISSVKDATVSLRKLIAKRKADLHRLDKDGRLLGKQKLERRLILERLDAEISTVSRMIVKYSRLKRSMQTKLVLLRRSIEKDTASLNRLLARYDKVRASILTMKDKLQKLSIDQLEESIRALDNNRVEVIAKIEEVTAEEREANISLARDQANLELNLEPSLARIRAEIKELEKQLHDRTLFLQQATSKTGFLTDQLAKLREQETQLLESSKKSKPILDNFEQKLAALRHREEHHSAAIAKVERELVSIERKIDEISNQERSLMAELSILGYSQQLKTFDSADVTLSELTREYNDLREQVNLLADRTYREIFEGYRNLSLRRNQLEAERDTIVRFIENVEAEKKRVFLDAFGKVDRELRAVFAKLTGGSAWLELENPDDIFSSGMFLMTQFPGKVPRESSSVSGGEKTVSAISFILAIQSVFPSPFYLFDEIDAHLDVVNAERLADLLRERSQSAQTILVTLKDSMVSRANLVYGVYIADAVSQVIRYRPGLEVAIKGVK